MTLRYLVLALLWIPVVEAQDTRYPPEGSQIPGPGASASPRGGNLPQGRSRGNSEFASWLADLKQWRRERLIRMGYNDAEYRRPELLWTQKNFVSPQSMVEDRYFYDPERRQYTVDRLLDDLDKRYGGIDSVLLWPVYPNIGIDNRNQWDLHRDMPGGVPALRKMVEDFHRRGVRVLFPAMPWDTGTRDEGVPHWTATARLMAEIGADGVNGDTFHGVPRAYRIASDQTGHPVAFEPELAPDSNEGIMWNVMNWTGLRVAPVPAASELKWLEPRHMMHVSDRWARDKTDDLQYAFFNGIGYVSWENVWGIWNQITPRDAEALRRVASIERRFAAHLVSAGWEPHTPTIQSGVFASKFPLKASTLWTVINRNEYAVEGDQISAPYRAGRKYYDLWHGVELQPRVVKDSAVLRFAIEGNGFAAVLAVEPGASVPELDAALRQAREWSAHPLAGYAHEWHVLPQRIVEIAATGSPSRAPEGMVEVPAGEFDFQVSGVEIEGRNWEGVDVQYPWEPSPRRYHYRRVAIKRLYVDREPVSNAEFKKFLDAAGYRPADDHNFLKDWKNGAWPAGWANKPVTWVSLEDARAYARWAGKRLPHEWEWQYAAQGTDGRAYPWGNDWDAAAVPPPSSGRELPPPPDLGTHPKGASPFGVLDTTATVWQWTDEFTDEHTRAAILRGGSYYRPQGSLWYFPQAQKLSEHGKYLLMAPSKDRAGTLGFRCVMDAP